MSNGDSLRKHNPLDWLGKRYLAWTAYGLIVLLCTLIQFTPHFLEIAGAKPMLLIAAVVCIAMYTGPTGGLITGAVAGFVWDIFGGGLLGLHGLLLMLCGTACGLLTWLLIRNNVLSATLLCSGAALVITLFLWGVTYVLFGKEQPFTVLLVYYLPDWLYTAVLSPLIYYAVRFSARRLRRQ